MKRWVAALLSTVMLATCPALAESSAKTASATAKGFGGDITVTLTVENGALTSVQIEGANETEGVGARAVELLGDTMVAANSVEVEAISGATVSSNAILAAAAEALAATGETLTAEATAVEQHMTPGTYYGEAYGKWKEGTIEGERFGSPL